MEREDGQRKYLIEADQFNDCLVGLEANTARFDVVWPGWPRKSCESEDSGMGRDNVGGRDGGDGGTGRSRWRRRRRSQACSLPSAGLVFSCTER